MQRARSAVTAIFFAGAAAALMVILRRGVPLARYRVEGDSMLPTYEEGARVLVNRWAYHSSAPRADDVVLFRDPEQSDRTLLKRVAFDAAWHSVYVLGDNTASSRDSRHFGEVRADSIIGRVMLRY